jgi:hypothetical protein
MVAVVVYHRTLLSILKMLEVLQLNRIMCTLLKMEIATSILKLRQVSK